MDDNTLLAHLDRQFAGVHRRLDSQDRVLLGLSSRMGTIEGADRVRATMFHSMPKPPAAKRLPRWQRLSLQVVCWGAAVVTTASGAWGAVKLVLAGTKP